MARWPGEGAPDEGRTVLPGAGDTRSWRATDGAGSGEPAPGADAGLPGNAVGQAGDEADPLGPDPRIPQGRRVFWNVVLGIDLVFIAALAVNNLWQGLLLGPLKDTASGQRAAEAAGSVAALDIWVNSIAILVLFGVVPLLWAYGTRGAGALRYLRFGGRKWEPLLGAGIGLALVFVVGILSVLYTVATQGTAALEDPGEVESEVTRGLIMALSVPLALGVAATAAVGEEIFFRGWLQRKVGWVWQGLAFAVVHAGYGTVMQVLGPLGIGLLFGYLVRRGLRLWTVIAAHFVYDLTLLLAALAARSMGQF